MPDAPVMIRREKPLFPFAIGALGSCLIAAAPPGQPPNLLPLHDVDISYLTPGSGHGRELFQRMRWSADTRKMRVDAPAPGLFMVVDYANSRMYTVSDRDQLVLEGPAPRTGVTSLLGSPNEHSEPFTRVGRDKVLGIDCTEWRTRDTIGQDTVACISDDGVLLRAVSSNVIVVLAKTVSFATQGPDVFQLPDNYPHRATAAPKLPR